MGPFLQDIICLIRWIGLVFQRESRVRMFIVPMYTKIYSNTEIPKDDTVGNAARNSDDK